MRKRNLIYISFITFLILGIYVSFTSHSPDKIFAEEPSTKNYNKDIFLSKLSKLLKIDKSELEDAIKKTKSEMIKEKSAKYVPGHKTHLKTEIEKALKVLIFNGTKKRNITVLQCNTEYPTPLKDANIKAMLTIKKRFKLNIGYSDHTEGIEASLAAAALGAKVIEKHITLNKNLPGPDHKASITPDELKKLVEGIQ